MTQAPALGTCSNCRFWEPPTLQPADRSAPDPDPGRCHFSPPLVLLEMAALTHWPRTMPTDWCGQWVTV